MDKINTWLESTGSRCSIFSEAQRLEPGRRWWAKLMFMLLPAVFSTTAANEVSRCVPSPVVAVDDLVPGMDITPDFGSGAGKKFPIDGEDDGGPYTGYRFVFGDYEVVTVRDYIDAIRITSPNLNWAHAIRLGTQRNTVDRALGFAEVFRDASSSQHLVCSDAGDVYAILRYKENRVTDIEIVMDRP